MFKYIALILIILAITGIITSSTIKEAYQNFKNSEVGETIKEGGRELDQALSE